MKYALLLSVAAASALSLAACQKKEEAPTAAAPEAAAPATPPPAADAAATAPAADTGPIEPAPAAAPAASGATAVTSAAPNANGTESTEALITGVTLTDMYQIQAGHIAETKGQAQGVKDFGKMMVTDHTAMTNQLKHIFAATKTKIPTELGPRGKRMIDALNAAAPADFDKLYLEQQQTAHAAELTLLSAYAEGGESTDIKPAVAKYVPKAQAHLDKVHELQAAPPP